MGRTAFITVVELFPLQEAIIRPHVVSKLILCLMLHGGFPPQAGYFWEILDKVVFSLLLSGNVFFQKLALFSGWRFGNLTSCVYYYPTKINTNEAEVEGFVTALSSQEGHAWVS